MSGLVAAVFADGGTVRFSPSPFGGTWAWCFASADGARLRGASGYILRGAWFGGRWVRSVQMECVAAVLALEALEDGWSGPVYSDLAQVMAKIASRRTTGSRTLPAPWVGRFNAALGRLGEVSFVQAKGHPSLADLQRGQTANGTPVSTHQVWCDAECRRQAAACWALTVGNEQKWRRLTAVRDGEPWG